MKTALKGKPIDHVVSILGFAAVHPGGPTATATKELQAGLEASVFNTFNAAKVDAGSSEARKPSAGVSCRERHAKNGSESEIERERVCVCVYARVCLSGCVCSVSEKKEEVKAGLTLHPKVFLPELKNREGASYTLTSGGLSHYTPDSSLFVASIVASAVSALTNGLAAETKAHLSLSLSLSLSVSLVCV